MNSILLVFFIQAIVWFLVCTTVPYAYMDEYFHVNQYLSFNRWIRDGVDFFWDPAITTFPGLYLVSLVPGLPLTYDLDTPSGHIVSILRGINAFIIFPAIFLVVYRLCNKSVSTAMIVCSMPFNWFYANLYYTDSVSTLFVLMALMFQKEGKLVKSGLIGFLAVLARQTNIVWIFGFSCLALLGSSKSSLFHLVKYLWVQILLGIIFVIFLKWNKGSVVLGHHEHHSVSLHWAQLNYLVLTVLGVAWPMLLTSLRNQKLGKMKYIFAFIVSSACAEFGTIIHPFILSDHRHYTFYLYQRIMRHRIVRSVLIPLVVAFVATRIPLTNPFAVISKSRFAPYMFWFCVILTIVPTPLIEFRYFNIPVSLILIELAKTGSRQIRMFTVLTATVINVVAMYVFLYRPFVSEDWGLSRFMY